MADIVKLWKDDLKSVSVKAAESLANPEEYPNLFPDLEFALQAEKVLLSRRALSADAYLAEVENRKRDLILEAREGRLEAPELESLPQEDLQQESEPEKVQVESAEEPEAPQPIPAEDDIDLDLEVGEFEGEVDIDVPELDLDDLE